MGFGKIRLILILHHELDLPPNWTDVIGFGSSKWAHFSKTLARNNKNARWTIPR
jgi:hypothetical protein